MNYKEYIKELRESSKKMDFSGLGTIADEYRKAANVIEELVQRNERQREIILEKIGVQ